MHSTVNSTSGFSYVSRVTLISLYSFTAVIIRFFSISKLVFHYFSSEDSFISDARRCEVKLKQNS